MKKRIFIVLMAILLVGFIASCAAPEPGDITAPSVNSTVPANAAVNVAIEGNLTAIFSEAMKTETISSTTFTLAGPGTTVVSGVVSLSEDGLTAIFNPAANLAGGTGFTATITTGAQDMAGNALESNYVWTFTTGVAPDTTAATVLSTVPAASATDIALADDVTATFSEAMATGTITGTSFTLAGPGTSAVAGVVSYTGTTATFNPAASLAYSTLYTATLTTAVTDLAGNPLAAAKVWTFTTGAASIPSLAAVDLGTAGDYVILSKTGITTTGTTAITGDIAVSPIDAAAMTGFSLVYDGISPFSTSTLVTGSVYASNYAVPTPANLSTAVSAMETAYTNAAGRTLPNYTEHASGNISGLTLVPGLYKWSTAVLINTDVTLSGNATDVWIFQIAGDLTMAASTSVVLSGGALPKNIFWQVAGDTGVTIGASSNFNGVVLARTAISLLSGASVNGRLLSQTAVTLIGNTITQPSP
ncbi:MAG: ice-binding family protein [Rectinemataceae bacterium]|nr:ice-binding family protein [Rectinemataceae bacterium]